MDHVSLFFGGPQGPSVAPSRQIASPMSMGDHFGLSLAAGDLNGDGLDDLLVGTVSGALSGPIAALTYDGTASGLTQSTQMPTLDPTQLYEREIGTGDINGDGFADAFIAFPARVTPLDDGGVLHGAVEIYPGSSRGVASAARWILLPPDTAVVAYGASLVRP
jgi:hypothetical protein